MISKQFKQASHDINMRNSCPKTTTLRQQGLSTEVDADKISLIKKKKKKERKTAEFPCWIVLWRLWTASESEHNLSPCTGINTIDG